MRRFNVSPSQLGWLMAQCERCAVPELLYGVKRPGGPPDAFSAADRAMKAYFENGIGGNHHDVGIGPAFTVIAQSMWTESAPLSFDDLEIEIVVRGKLDALVRNENDRTIVVDYKTKVNDVPIDATYAPQLAAYAFGLENPVDGVQPCNVDGLALLVYNATAFGVKPEHGTSGLFGKTDWIDVERDDTKFLGLLRHVATLLAGAESRPNRGCAYRAYYGAVPLPIGGAA